jgi:hypothetical protein
VFIHLYNTHILDFKTNSAIQSWEQDNIINVPVTTDSLSRTLNGLPYIKDIFNRGIAHCEADDDVVIFSNTDIFLINEGYNFPKTQFFSVRKNVPYPNLFTRRDLQKISYEYTVNCDTFGFTKKWYVENQHRIPDFVLGRPFWDIAMLFILDGIRINNITYHAEHLSNWKQLDPQDITSLHNKELYYHFLEENNIKITNSNRTHVIKYKLFDVLKEKYDYLNRPVFITFYTESHKQIFEEIFLPTFSKTFGDNNILIKKYYKEQLCDTAQYYDRGWKNTQIEKIQFTLSTLKQLPDGNIFIFCDADICFKENFIEFLKEELYGYDMVAQKSFSTMYDHNFCSGFYAGVKNQNTVTFLTNILNSLRESLEENRHADQYFFNEHSSILRIKPLPSSFLSLGKFSESAVIKTDYEIDTFLEKKKCKQATLLHANFIKGVSRKYRTLQKYLDLD